MPTPGESPITLTEPGTATRIAVELCGGRHQVRAGGGTLRAQRLHGPDDRARVALVGQTALLLGGDEVELDVEVGAGARLDLSDIAGTVAYHGRGRPASWHTRIRLGPGARLAYRAEPLVVSDGADVIRSLTVELADGAAARVRETMVFGRSGECGGRLDSSTSLFRTEEEFCRERLVTNAQSRSRPGVLAGVRVMDAVLALGVPAPDRHDATSRFQLLEPDCTITRFLGSSLAASPLS